MLTHNFDALVEKSLRRAWEFLGDELQTVKTEVITESVFRYFFIRSLPTNEDVKSYETEWNGLVDLCVEMPDATIVIEFKLYLYRYHQLGGGRRRPKGGAGPKNEGEFFRSWRKLAAATSRDFEPAIAARYIVLVYEDDSRKNQRSFELSYSGLCESTIPDGCKGSVHFTMPPLKINDERRLKCVLFRVKHCA